MCDFCENMNNEKKILYRTCYADDNVCSFIRPEYDDSYNYINHCENCHGCKDENNEFRIGMKWDNYLDVSYTRIIPSNLNKEFNEFNLSAISEGIKINYCPFCGRKLKEN